MQTNRLILTCLTIVSILLFTQIVSAKPVSDWKRIFGKNIKRITVRIMPNETNEKEITGYYLDQFPCYQLNYKNNGDFRIRRNVSNTIYLECLYPPEEITFAIRDMKKGNKDRINSKAKVHSIITCPVVKDDESLAIMGDFITHLDTCYEQDIPDILR